MNKNNALGLVILVVMLIVAAVLWRVYLAGPPKAGPAPAVTSKPPVAPPQAVTPAKPEPPEAPPIKTEPPTGIAPLKEPGPQITILPPPAIKEHYGILVESYSNYRDAAKMLDKLKKSGHPAFVQRDPRDPNLFQVWLGPFSSQEEALAAEKALRSTLKKPLKIEQIENPVPK